MAIVSVGKVAFHIQSELDLMKVGLAIIISFHLKREPSRLELRMALPFGIIFWFLSLACLLSGLFNYYHTVMQYSKRSAIVQSGWKTEMVSFLDL
jgi:hypothetical protein